MIMNKPQGGMAAAHVDERLSGYLDGELTQQDRQRVALHLDECGQCRQLLGELEVLRERMGKSSLSSKHENEWREEMDDVGVKLSRGLGWLLFLGALLIIGGFVIYSFLTDPGITAWWKTVFSAFYLGLAGLFISVLRQRLIERKTDKYKDVEI
jgi:predicted anti-sigma-YlaC factor YlaD